MACRQLIVLPLLVAFWGIEYYGEWLIITAVPSFLSMTNLGIGTATATRVSTLVASKDFAKALQAFANGMVGVLLTAALLLCSTTACLFFFPLSGWLHVENANTVLTVLVATTIVKMTTQPFHGWWVGLGKAARANNYYSLLSFGELLVFVLIPLVGASALTVVTFTLVLNAIWFLLFSLATGNLIQVTCRRILKRFLITWSEIIELTIIGLGHQLSPLWQAILFQGSLLTAGLVLSPGQVALWGAMRVINRSGNQVLEMVSQTVGPEYQVHSGRAEQKELRSIHGLAMLVSVVLAVVMALSLLTIGPSLFRTFTMGKLEVSQPAWLIMTLSLIPCSIWWSSGEFLRSTNKPWFINLSGTILACFSIFMMYLLRNLGVTGLAIGAMCFELGMAMLVVNRSLYLLGDSLYGIIRRTGDGFKFLKVRNAS